VDELFGMTPEFRVREVALANLITFIVNGKAPDGYIFKTKAVKAFEKDGRKIILLRESNLNR
jgi:hypothetical protein